MNINVWIIKICKALKQSFWIGFLLMNLSVEVLQPPSLLPQLTQGKKSLLPAVLIYRHVLKGSSKCSFRLTESTSFYLHFSCLSCFFFILLFRIVKQISHTHSWDLTPTFILILLSLGCYSEGKRRMAEMPIEILLRFAPYLRLEVMSKQVIIMRWALQKLTRFSKRSVTHSRASRYSRESSSNTCSKSTVGKKTHR